MKLTVLVIDGFHGRPAGGIRVSVVRPAGIAVQAECHGSTDESGEFRLRSAAERPDAGENIQVELDIDAYYSAFGIVSFCTKACTYCRIVDSADEYRVVVVITPFMQATFGAR